MFALTLIVISKHGTVLITAIARNYWRSSWTRPGELANYESFLAFFFPDKLSSFYLQASAIIYKNKTCTCRQIGHFPYSLYGYAPAHIMNNFGMWSA